MTKPSKPETTSATTAPVGAQPASGAEPSNAAAPPVGAQPGERQTPFARFFSSVEGRLVSRYGSGTAAMAPTLIGATRNAADMSARLTAGGQPEPNDVGRGEGGVSWNTDEVVAISALEASRFGREYDRAVRDGALVERTEADYLAAVAKARGLSKDTLAKAAAESTAKANKAGTSPEGS